MSDSIKIFHKIMQLFLLVDESFRRMRDILLSQKAGEINALSTNIIQAIGSITAAAREYLPEYADDEMVCLEDELYSELQSFKYAINILSYDYALHSLEKSLLPAFVCWRKAIEKYIIKHTAA